MRRGRVLGGIVVVLAAAALTAPYAFGASGSAVDQGYPCATTPPAAGSGSGNGGGGAGQCSSGSTKPVTHVAAATHTVKAPVAAAVAPATHTSGTLPFTGIQLTMFVVIGVLLVGGGLVLRASGRRGSDG